MKRSNGIEPPAVLIRSHRDLLPVRRRLAASGAAPVCIVRGRISGHGAH